MLTLDEIRSLVRKEGLEVDIVQLRPGRSDGSGPCGRSVGELVAYALGEEDPEMDAHLEACERCRDRLDCVRRVLEVTLHASERDEPRGRALARVVELFPREEPAEEG
jgi:hypothetical protein